jgi:uncharacterized UBP type Zn finger protein
MRRRHVLGNGIAGRWRGRREQVTGYRLQVTGSTEEESMAGECSHLNQIKVTTTKTHVCEECVKMGDRWVHLRLCMECGNVGCCDSSKNKHATKHFHATKHPLMRSIEPGEAWVWCFVDDMAPGEVLRGEFVAG